MCKIHVPATSMACPYCIQATSGDHKLSLLNRVLISFDKEDEWLRWSNTKGWFSIKYFYNVLFGGELRDEGWKSNWNNLVPLKILACCGWLLGFKKTLATDKHEKKGHILVNGCLLCLVAEDSTNRLLIHWTFAARVWVTVLKRFGICWAMRRTIIEASVFRSSKKKKKKKLWNLSLFTGVWKFWLEQYNRVFHNESSAAEEVVDSIMCYVSNWASWDKDFEDVSIQDLTRSWILVFKWKGPRNKLRALHGLPCMEF